jgi:hypothetical protein
MYPAFEKKNHDLLHPACAVFLPSECTLQFGKQNTVVAKEGKKK